MSIRLLQYVSKHQRAILVIGFLSSRIVILWSTILRMLSMFLTWKILVKISHYSHVEERKDVFYPQAICKAIVPNTFRIFLPQWRFYINSTIHSPAEPVLARDLYGNLCSRYLAAWLAKSKSMTVLLGTLKTLSSRSWRHVFSFTTANESCAGHDTYLGNLPYMGKWGYERCTVS